MALHETTPVYSIKSVLFNNEEIIYSCKPNPKAFFFSQLFKMSPFVLIWLCFDLFAIVMSLTAENGSVGLLFALIPFFAVHLTPVWIWLYGFIKDIKECKYTEYAITNQRLIIKGGQKVKDIILIDLAKIQALNLHIGFFDGLFKVGDLYITTDTKICVVFDIKEPKKVMTELCQLAQNKKIKLYENSKPTSTF